MIRKVETKDAKERLSWVHETQSQPIVDMVRSIMAQNPFYGHRFYIFAHKRTIGLDERITQLAKNTVFKSLEEIPEMKILWQARLTKPQAQENSMLFKVYPDEEEKIEIKWIIPEKEKFDLYQKGKFFQCQIVAESIHDYIHDKAKLEFPDPDDLSDEEIRVLYKNIRRDISKKKTNDASQAILRNLGVTEA